MEQVFFNLPLSELEPIFKRWIKEAQEELQPKTFNYQKETKQFLTVEEAANFLTLAVPTIYSKVHKNELPHFKRGKRLYFTTTDLIAYLNEGRKKTNNDIDAEVDNLLKKKGDKNA